MNPTNICMQRQWFKKAQLWERCQESSLSYFAWTFSTIH